MILGCKLNTDNARVITPKIEEISCVSHETSEYLAQNLETYKRFITCSLHIKEEKAYDLIGAVTESLLRRENNGWKYRDDSIENELDEVELVFYSKLQETKGMRKYIYALISKYALNPYYTSDVVEYKMSTTNGKTDTVKIIAASSDDSNEDDDSNLKPEQKAFKNTGCYDSNFTEVEDKMEFQDLYEFCSDCCADYDLDFDIVLAQLIKFMRECKSSSKYEEQAGMIFSQLRDIQDEFVDFKGSLEKVLTTVTQYV